VTTTRLPARRKAESPKIAVTRLLPLKFSEHLVRILKNLGSVKKIWPTTAKKMGNLVNHTHFISAIELKALVVRTPAPVQPVNRIEVFDPTSSC
jgi:hypothetical protein